MRTGVQVATPLKEKQGSSANLGGPDFQRLKDKILHCKRIQMKMKVKKDLEASGLLMVLIVILSQL